MGPPSALEEFGECDMRKNFSAVGFSAVGIPEPKTRLREGRGVIQSQERIAKALRVGLQDHGEQRGNDRAVLRTLGTTADVAIQ